MTASLIQAPLPWLPEDAVVVAPGIGVIHDGDGGGAVWVHGLVTFTWEPGDTAGRKLAAVQLSRVTGADFKAVAAAFGTDEASFWRWRRAHAEDGLAGLLPAKRGPKGPSKLTPQVTARIRDLAAGAEKLSVAQIGRRCGVSEFAVRVALGRAGNNRPAAPRPAPAEPAGRDAGGWEQDELPVLPDPVPRDAERVLARFGLLGEGAAPVFTPSARVPSAGLLLALPALAATGLLATARGVYGRLKDGFYGLDTMLMMLVFLALAREPRAEGATRLSPAALGRVLGLDRAPEVKTIRRKLGELARAGKAAAWQETTARHHADAAGPDELGFLYIDGHTRAYFGTREVQKTHIARLRFPAPATEETWVADAAGAPMLVVIGEPSESLAGQIRDLLPQLRRVCGEPARPVLCFDRGGWSPDLFADVIAARFGLLTYRKNEPGKPLPDLPGGDFTVSTWKGDDGRVREYDLADHPITLAVTSGTHKGEKLALREITRRDKGKQVRMLTTVPAGDLSPAGVAYKMTGRWREENWFRYGRAHFALDALDSYATAPENPGRLVPNPAKKQAAAQVKTARDLLATTQAAREQELGRLRSPAPGQETLITNAMLARLDAPVASARRRLGAAQDTAKQVPAKIPLSQHAPGMIRLDAETKLITHAIRMAAYNTETTLARALAGNYARSADEAYALIRETWSTSGDIIPGNGTLTIRLDPLSAPRRTRALTALCQQLTDAGTRYPGTSLILRYEVKPHPGTA